MVSIHNCELSEQYFEYVECGVPATLSQESRRVELIDTDWTQKIREGMRTVQRYSGYCRTQSASNRATETYFTCVPRSVGVPFS